MSKPYDEIAITSLLAYFDYGPEEMKKDFEAKSQGVTDKDELDRLKREAASAYVSTHSMDDIEKSIGSKGSIESGVKAMVDSLRKAMAVKGVKVEDGLEDQLLDDIFQRKETTECKSFADLTKIIDNARSSNVLIENVVLDSLTATHDRWVADNGHKLDKKINSRDAFQYTEFEVIGFNEGQKDLIFLDPIYAAAGVEIDRTELENAYSYRSSKFYTDLMDKYGKDQGPALEEHIKSGEYLARVNPELSDKITSDNFQEIFQCAMEHGLIGAKEFLEAHPEVVEKYGSKINSLTLFNKFKDSKLKQDDVTKALDAFNREKQNNLDEVDKNNDDKDTK